MLVEYQYVTNEDQEVGYYQCDQFDFVKLLQRYLYRIRCLHVKQQDGHEFIGYWKTEKFNSIPKFIIDHVKPANIITQVSLF